MNKKIKFKLKHKNARSVSSGISGNYRKTRLTTSELHTFLENASIDVNAWKSSSFTMCAMYHNTDNWQELMGGYLKSKGCF